VKSSRFARISDQGGGTGCLDKKAEATGREYTTRSDLVEDSPRFHFPDDPGSAIYEINTTRHQHRASAHAKVAGRDRPARKGRHGWRMARREGQRSSRFELTYAALAPELKVHRADGACPNTRANLRAATRCLSTAPRRHQGGGQREEAYSMRSPLFCTFPFESGILEDPWAEPPADMF